MPAGSIALDFILRSKYLQIREPCCAIGDVSNRAYHYITREIVDHAAAHHQIEAAIGQKLRQIVDRSPHYVTARSEPAYRVFTWIDALISRGRSKVPDHRLPATLARTHIQHGADRMRQHVLGRGQREADQSLEIGGRPHAMLRMAIPLVEVAPVKTPLFDHDVGRSSPVSRRYFRDARVSSQRSFACHRGAPVWTRDSAASSCAACG